MTETLSFIGHAVLNLGALVLAFGVVFGFWTFTLHYLFSGKAHFKARRERLWRKLTHYLEKAKKSLTGR